MTPHRPRVIFEFEYGHRGPAKLQRTVRQYLSDPYVSAVLVMKVYHPRLHGERQAFAILFTQMDYCHSSPVSPLPCGFAAGVTSYTRLLVHLSSDTRSRQDAQSVTSRRGCSTTSHRVVVVLSKPSCPLLRLC